MSPLYITMTTIWKSTLAAIQHSCFRVDLNSTHKKKNIRMPATRFLEYLYVSVVSVYMGWFWQNKDVLVG